MVPVIRDAGAMSFDGFVAAYDALVEKARTNTLTADDLVGANVTLTNPGGIGTVASVPRLMSGQGTIVATGSIAYPVGLGGIGEQIGAEKVMTMTSTYDHRVIQGAESGRFLALVEGRLQGEHDFYEGVFAALGVELGPAPSAPAPTAARAPPAPDPGHSPRRADVAGGAGGEHAGAPLPQPRASRRAPGPARVRARGRAAAGPGDRGADAAGDGADPGSHPAHVCAGRDARRGAAALAPDLLRDDRL